MAGVILIIAGLSLMVGVGLSEAAVRWVPEPGAALVRTVHVPGEVSTRVETVRVHGRVVRRYDHVIIVRVPRVVVVTRGTSRRIIVPAHLVRVLRLPGTSPVMLVQSVGSSVPVTVTVPVTVPASTVTLPPVTSTVTLPQATTTVTLPATTITLPVTGDQ